MPSKPKSHQWVHAQLVKHVEYKANELGIEVVYVGPADTSKRCCECGHTGDGNRPERDCFACAKCGARANADYNAAENVGWRRTGDSQLALNSKTVTPNRGFVSYAVTESYWWLYVRTAIWDAVVPDRFEMV